jgi:hypothetical protein
MPSSGIREGVSVAAHSKVELVEVIRPLVASAFWTDMERFHVAVHGDCSNGREGRFAFRYFRSLLERNWIDGNTDDHPFRDLVGMASDYQHSHIIECIMKKLPRPYESTRPFILAHFTPGLAEKGENAQIIGNTDSERLI